MQFVNLRSDLVVVTGSIYVEGGEKSTRRDLTERGKNRDKIRVVQDREVSHDRRQALSIAAGYHRKFQRLRLLRTTPLGTLYDASTLAELKTLFLDLTKRASDFNKDSVECRMLNCLVWEPLVGNRKAAFEGYLARRAADGDAAVVTALKLLSPASAASQEMTARRSAG